MNVEKNNKSKSVLVLGMHRSGTSAVAAGLKKVFEIPMGDGIGIHNSHNTKGYFENFDIVKLNNKILRFLDASWDSIGFGRMMNFADPSFSPFYRDALDIIKSKYDNCEIWGVKDPRITVLLPFWEEVIREFGGEIYRVIVLRNPLEVALSQQSRHDQTPLDYLCGEDLGCTLNLWFWYNLCLMTDLNGDNNIIVSFDELLDRPENELYRLGRFLHIEPDPEELAGYCGGFLEKKLKHHTVGYAEIESYHKDYPHVFELYDRMKKFSLKSEFSKENARKVIEGMPDGRILQSWSSSIYSYVAAAGVSTENRYGGKDRTIEVLKQEKEKMQREKECLLKENERILSSRSWRYTKPLRVFIALIRFDKYYLYNAAQKIRHGIGRYREVCKLRHPRFSRYIFEPWFKITKRIFKPILRATVYRLLSLSQIAGIDAISYESNYQDDQDFSQYKTDIKAIAFYLPQFHQIPENDEWWGEGFTEWTNTRKAIPLFEGHYQPREPHDDIGYYDLSEIDVLKKQVKLARQHGIYGFCFYHYYFHGKRLLEKPIDLLLSHPEIDVNFCLCWANENWSRTWDGAEHEILIAQKHSAEDDINFCEDIARYLKDPRYIRIDGKPVIMIYHPRLLPDPAATFERWRQYCRKNGIGEIVIWVARSFASHEGLGLKDVAEAEVEFPPHLTASLRWMWLPREKKCMLKFPLSDYCTLVNNIVKYEAVADKLDYPVYRTAMLGWDNTARKGKEGTVYYGFSLRQYYKWLIHIIENSRKKFRPEERFVFINAWNEWAEGTYLEPDKKYGYASINTTSKALFGLAFNFNQASKKRTKNDDDQRVVESAHRSSCLLTEKCSQSNSIK